MKGWMKIFIAVVVVLVALLFVKDMVVKFSVENGIEYVTGLKLRMGSLRLGLVKTDVDIKDLKIDNPKGYKDKVMIDMPRIYVEYSLPEVIKGNIHLKDVKIDLKELVVVKNEKGELNLNSLNVVKGEEGAKAPAGKAKAMNLRIDNLDLKIDRVVYKDYSAGGAPTVKEFNVGIDESFSNIDDPAELVKLLIVKSLANTNISRLTGFDLTGLSGEIGSTLSNATEAAASTASEVTKQASETVKNLLPFGKK